MSRPSFKDFKNKALKNTEVKKEYDELIPIYELRKKLIEMRVKKGLTQAEIAKRMGTNKSNISRLECGENVSYPTLATISKYLRRLGIGLVSSLNRLFNKKAPEVKPQEP